MTSITLTVDDDGIALLSIDVQSRPMNLATIALGEELAALIERIAGDSEIRGVILTSGKKDFMAGGDINGLVESFPHLGDPETVYNDIARPFSGVLRRLETSGKPFAAAINGSALGAGLEIALACHYRVVADVPKLILGLPEVGIGLIPGAGGSQRLPRLIGIRSAVPLLLEGTILTPAKALELRIVDAVVSPSDLIATARTWLIEKGDAVQPWDKKGYKVPGGAGLLDPAIAQFFNITTSAVSASKKHNFPAPVALLSAVARGTAVPLDAGLRIESREFTRLLRDPVARNLMRTNFVLKGECDKLARRPAAFPQTVLRNVGVIGAGLMGAGIAQVSAEAGLAVTLLDASLAQAEGGLRRISESLDKRVHKGKLTSEAAAAILERVSISDDYAALASSDIVVEAVFENLEVKAAVYRKLHGVLASHALIASNTSALPISALAEGISAPERFIGLHFFSPVDRMALVEVVRGRVTDGRSLAVALDYVKLLRKTPIVVNDGPGFFTSRVITAYLFEAVGMIGDGVSPWLVDNAATQAGFAIGPISLLDELTLDLTYYATCKRRDAAGASWREPYGFSVFEKFVASLDRKGRRYGAGFYDYPDGKRQPWAGLSDVYSALSPPPSLDELKHRMLYIQVLEAARAFEEGVITNAGDGDVGSVLGIGFPAHTGGVFSLLDTIGAKSFVNTCDRLADRFGERFRPSEWLRERAVANTLFYPVKPLGVAS